MGNTLEDLQRAFGEIGLNLKQVGNHWGTGTEGWRLEAYQATPAALVVDAERLGEPERIRRSIGLISPTVQVDHRFGKVTLTTETDQESGQEVVLFGGGGIIFSPEFDPTRLGNSKM